MSKLVSSSLVTRICSKIHFWSPPIKGRITPKPETPQGQQESWVDPRRIPDKRTLQHSEKVTRFKSYHRKYFHFRRKNSQKWPLSTLWPLKSTTWKLKTWNFQTYIPIFEVTLQPRNPRFMISCTTSVLSDSFSICFQDLVLSILVKKSWRKRIFDF